MEEGSQSASGASGEFLQRLGWPGVGWSKASQLRHLLSVPEPKRGPVGLEGKPVPPIPRPSAVGKVRVCLHGESGPRVPTLMGRCSNPALDLQQLQKLGPCAQADGRLTPTCVR